MSYEAFCQEFAEVMEVPCELISDEFNMERDAAWDSLAFLSTIALIDKHFNFIATGDALEKVATYADLKALIMNKGQ